MAEKYAAVIVDVTPASMNQAYWYLIPEKLEDETEPGSCVLVPFGRGKRTVTGYVAQVTDKPETDLTNIRLREIQEIRHDRVSLASKMIRLALWMQKTYGSSLNNALKAVLPVREKESEPQSQNYYLAVPEEEGQRLLEIYEKKHYTAKARMIRALLEEGQIGRAEAVHTLKMTSSGLDTLVRDGVIRQEACISWRMPADMTDEESGEKQAVLSQDQRKVCEGILTEWAGEDRPCLIQGVTGSGKTLVYMELIRHILDEGRQAIVLIPEIALSWQTVRRFRASFGDAVTVLNSKMSRGERADQFERAKRGEVSIVVGPRSALFTPFSNPGLIIIDEEQEPSYRSETAPRYDARETALKRAELEHAHVVFGSATPSLDAYDRCKKGRYALFRLPRRYGDASLPQVTVVDMRKELREGNRLIFSRTLCEKIRDRLDRKEQVMLFLNRRGYEGFVSCRSCGQPVKCPHCDVALTWHRNGRLVCHYCGYQISQMTRCPHCGSPYIGGYRAGTEKVEAETKKLFPDAKIIRMDADTTRKKDGYGQILKAFAGHEADILIGTQMIVKGHDFPDVTLVGVLAADLSLYASDYRAPERTYQLLVQAVGRAGRGSRPGEAVIQTYAPDHYCIRDAVAQDYEAFYEEEMTGREMLRYPPAANLLAVHGTGQEEEKLDRAMRAIRRFLRRYENGETTVIGPAPESVKKIKDSYRQVLYVKDDSLKRIEGIRQMTEKYIEINSGFRGLFFQYDLNA